MRTRMIATGVVSVTGLPTLTGCGLRDQGESVGAAGSSPSALSAQSSPSSPDHPE
ncbi:MULTISPECIES: hypothetical protein [unclassified Streptomyces]|uniref:hypothetical protein n=1 Tax=unclassified Streptomyces TaxID=2593676 RepID=UPI002DDA6A81|nr:hypothetical protein [Streptomyces sp. NBC_00243]WRZ20484.1 hypothetical protein OHT59_19275 [Streptomyces sp. NBC_00243]